MRNPGGFIFPFGHVEHYYGNQVRAAFIVAAIALGIHVPFSGDLYSSLMAGVPAILVLVVLAGLTSPHGRVIMTLDCIVAGAGILIGEMAAFSFYDSEQYIQFAILEFFCLTLLAALYYGVKTARAMATGRLGVLERENEF